MIETIEELTAERDQAVALLREMVDWHERGDMDSSPLFAADYRHDLNAARSFLASLGETE